jgi:hypothetical protein
MIAPSGEQFEIAFGEQTRRVVDRRSGIRAMKRS